MVKKLDDQIVSRKTFAGLFCKKAAILSIVLLCGCLAPGTNYVGGNYETVTITPDLVTKLNTEVPAKKPHIGYPSLEKDEVEDELSRYVYRIGKGDVLLVKMLQPAGPTPQVSIALPNEQAGTAVDDAGNIVLPHVGKVNVEGKSIDEARAFLTQKMAEYFRAPQVDVTVLKFASQTISVTGEVKKAGAQYLAYEPWTVLKAISAAEGFLDTADLENVIVNHKDGTFSRLNLQDLYSYGKIAENIVLASGDNLHIPSGHRNKVFLMGEFVKPVTQKIKDGSLTLAEVINDNGGMNQITSNAQLYVIRRDIKTEAIQDNKPASFENAVIYHLDATSADSMVLADQFRLKPRDVVYVATAKVTQWNRVISQLVPSTLFNAVDSKRFD